LGHCTKATQHGEISSGQSAPIRNFMIEDPGGYTVEFFQWL